MQCVLSRIRQFFPNQQHPTPQVRAEARVPLPTSAQSMIDEQLQECAQNYSLMHAEASSESNFGALCTTEMSRNLTRISNSLAILAYDTFASLPEIERWACACPGQALMRVIPYSPWKNILHGSLAHQESAIAKRWASSIVSVTKQTAGPEIQALADRNNVTIFKHPIDDVPSTIDLETVLDHCEKLKAAADNIKTASQAAKVLVNCSFGINRSSQAIATHLMMHEGLSLEEAVKQVYGSNQEALIFPKGLIALQILYAKEKLGYDDSQLLDLLRSSLEEVACFHLILELSTKHPRTSDMLETTCSKWTGPLLSLERLLELSKKRLAGINTAKLPPSLVEQIAALDEVPALGKIMNGE